MGISSVFLGTISNGGDTCFTQTRQDQVAYPELRFVLSKLTLISKGIHNCHRDLKQIMLWFKAA